MARVLADNADHAVPADNAAGVAKLFDGSSHFHDGRFGIVPPAEMPPASDGIKLNGEYNATPREVAKGGIYITSFQSGKNGIAEFLTRQLRTGG